MKKVIKNIFPTSIKLKLKLCIKNFKLLTLKFFSLSNFTVLLYYGVFNRAYSNEQKSILYSRIMFDENNIKPTNSSPQLRRNIHRLEKGLSIQPRRDIFGEAFILETVMLLENSIRSKTVDSEELNWGVDVLNKYFEVVGSSEIIERAKSIYQDIKENINRCNKSNRIPYLKETLPEISLSFEQLYSLCKRRSSVRWYTEEPVSDDDISSAINIAKLAPSACNRQPFEFLVINDRKIAPKVASFANGTAGFSNQIPCLILVIGDLSCYPTEADRHVIYIDSALASMQLMLALETKGLNTCPINWPELKTNERKLRDYIKLPNNKRVVMMISVGVGKDDSFIPFSVKKPVSILRTSLEDYK